MARGREAFGREAFGWMACGREAFGQEVFDRGHLAERHFANKHLLGKDETLRHLVNKSTFIPNCVDQMSVGQMFLTGKRGAVFIYLQL